MKRFLCALAVCAMSGLCWAGFGDDLIIARGDANHSGAVNVSDASFILNYLYQGGAAPPCLNEADANKDGIISSADASYLLNWLFSGGPAPPSPGPYNTSCLATSPHISCSVGC